MYRSAAVGSCTGFILSPFFSLPSVSALVVAEDLSNSPDEKKPVPSATAVAPTTSSAQSMSGPAGSERMAAKAAQARQENSYAGFWPARFKMAVSYRGRFEHPSGRNYSRDKGDGYYLNRLRLEAALQVNQHVDLFAMTQDSRVIGYDDPRKRPMGMMDVFDLRQAYIDIHDELRMGTLAMRIGRQNMNFGSKRLVGIAEWGNSPPVFDAAKFYFTTLQDALYADNGSAVIMNPKATSRHVGWEPDLQVTCKLTRRINIGGGYGRLVPGSFLRQSTPASSYNFPYLIWDFRF